MPNYLKMRANFSLFKKYDMNKLMFISSDRYKVKRDSTGHTLISIMFMHVDLTLLCCNAAGVGQRVTVTPCLCPCCLCWVRETWSWPLSLSSPLLGWTPGISLCTHGRHNVWFSSTQLTMAAADARLKSSKPRADRTLPCDRSNPPRWPISSCTSVTARATGPSPAWTQDSSNVSQSWLATSSKVRCTVTSNRLSISSATCPKTRWTRWVSCFTVLCQSLKYCLFNPQHVGFHKLWHAKIKGKISSVCCLVQGSLSSSSIFDTNEKGSVAVA